MQLEFEEETWLTLCLCQLHFIYKTRFARGSISTQTILCGMVTLFDTKSDLALRKTSRLRAAECAKLWALAKLVAYDTDIALRHFSVHSWLPFANSGVF